MNVSFRSEDWRESILSNLAPTPFIIVINEEPFECGSVEGFWQGLKCENERTRKHVFKLGGMKAKYAGSGKSLAFFQIAGRIIDTGSPEHEGLIREAIKQKFLQNPKAAQALRESHGEITHRIPGRHRPIFAVEKLLMSVRKELFGH